MIPRDVDAILSLEDPNSSSSATNGPFLPKSSLTSFLEHPGNRRLMEVIEEYCKQPENRSKRNSAIEEIKRLFASKTSCKFLISNEDDDGPQEERCRLASRQEIQRTLYRLVQSHYWHKHKQPFWGRQPNFGGSSPTAMMSAIHREPLPSTARSISISPRSASPPIVENRAAHADATSLADPTLSAPPRIRSSQLQYPEFHPSMYAPIDRVLTTIEFLQQLERDRSLDFFLAIRDAENLLAIGDRVTALQQLNRAEILKTEREILANEIHSLQQISLRREQVTAHPNYFVGHLPQPNPAMSAPIPTASLSNDQVWRSATTNSGLECSSVDSVDGNDSNGDSASVSSSASSSTGASPTSDHTTSPPIPTTCGTFREDGDTPLQPRSTDVVNGRGMRETLHPGNHRFREVVDPYYEEYQQSDAKQKKEMARAIITQLMNEWVRFITQDSKTNKWRRQTPKEMQNKITKRMSSLKRNGRNGGE